MGTWSAEIFGNDTSCEVKEYFYSEYNSGMEPEDILSLINQKFECSLNLDEDKNNVLFSLAFCLWETKSLSNELFNTVCDIIKNKTDLEIWKSLEADEDFLKEREKYLTKYLNKISVERAKSKKRIKPPVQIKSDFETGSCLSFLYPDNNYGGIIIISCEFFKNHGSLNYAVTNIHQKEKPDFQTFLNSKLFGFEWEEVYGQAQRKAAFDNKTARIWTYSLDYEKNTKDNFFKYNSSFFEIIGQLPPFTQCLLGISGGKTLYVEPFDRFKELMSRDIVFNKNRESDKTESKETLEKLSKVLVKEY